MTTSTAAHVKGAHLVGSLPLNDAEDVFKTVGSELGDHVRRIPDGETGPRSQWIGWAVTKFFEVPQLEGRGEMYMDVSPRSVHLKEGAKAEDVVMPNLEYADVAIEAFSHFERLQADGTIAKDCRFQVAMGTPVATSSSILSADAFKDLEATYEQAQMADVQRILDTIPHDKLAIQWDVCLELWWWEGWMSSAFEPMKEGIFERLARYSNAIPADVELGYHLCFGDYQGKHLDESDDLRSCVDIINGAAAKLERPLTWVHMPVPVQHDDEGYFAPLEDLKVDSETEVYLGLVHLSDGVEGAQGRIKAASAAISEFGLATECGMGRRPTGAGEDNKELLELLRIHREAAQPVR
ncbi:MAG TPA: hypothetical protein VM493_00985 [Vicinamibacterales bacterium]|nr:hypothetical protein [Vicinamibacterales bacterium]